MMGSAGLGRAGRISRDRMRREVADIRRCADERARRGCRRKDKRRTGHKRDVTGARIMRDVRGAETG